MWIGVNSRCAATTSSPISEIARLLPSLVNTPASTADTSIPSINDASYLSIEKGTVKLPRSATACLS